jgi:hypothetical protein
VICPCKRTHVQRRVVLSGGPGAGKIAILELVVGAFLAAAQAARPAGWMRAHPALPSNRLTLRERY